MEPQKKLTRKEKIINQGGQPSKPKPSAKKNPKLFFNLGLSIAILAVILYINTLGNGFVYDDVNVITRNHYVKEGVSSIPQLLKTSYRFGYFEGEDELYRPLPMILFATFWQMFPDNPLPGHFANIVLYAFTAFFLFKLLQKLMTSYNIVIPFIAVVLFIAHPVHTEVVANIKSVDEIISFLFIIITFLFLLRYIDRNEPKNVLFAAGCFFLALLSKESAITMFVIIPLTLWFFRDVQRAMLIRISSYLFIPLFVYFLMRVNALGTITGNKHFAFIDNILVAAPDTMTRLATAFYLLTYYVRLIFFPYPLLSDYSYSQFVLTGWDNTLSVLSLIFHAGIFIYAIITIKRKNIIAYGILFYLLTIALSSNIFVVIGSPFAERFLYMPLLGATIIMSYLFSKIVHVKEDDLTQNISFADLFRSKKIIFIIVFVLLIPMSYETIARNSDWESDYSLFSTDSKKSPESARLHFSYADNIMLEKVMKTSDEKEKSAYLTEALKEYDKAIEIYPDYADAYGQRGFVHFLRGEKKKAYEDYKVAIDKNTFLETTYNNMGYLFSETGEHDKALQFYLKSAEIGPRFFEAWRNLGSTYYALKDFNKAISAFSTALKLSPENADINYFLGLSYQAIGDNASAQQCFEHAKLLDPGKYK
jgi:tetratricopeptide (TPR) repeat protein